jgi:G:T-mismatch repair DNA endonuclease (very short patch repair protein)
MEDVSTGRKRSKVMTRIRSRGSESLEVEIVAAEAEVVADVGDDAARHVARMSGESDQTVGWKGFE